MGLLRGPLNFQYENSSRDYNIVYTRSHFYDLKEQEMRVLLVFFLIVITLAVLIVYGFYSKTNEDEREN